MTWNYFLDSEIAGLDLELIAMLDKARHRSGIPYTITDGLRAPKDNTDPNAVTDSAHLIGKAVDLLCQDSNSLWRMLDGLFFAGFKRIGIYFKTENGKTFPTHIHVDNSTSHPPDVVWLTPEL